METKTKDKEELIGQVIDKLNELNKIQIEKIDQCKAILRHPSVDDLTYLIMILDKEINRSKGSLNESKEV